MAIITNEALKIALIRSGKPEGDIARRAGIHHSLFSKIKHGHRPASKKEQRAIARALKVAVTDIFPEAA